MPTVKQGELVELDIEKFADKGKSLARVDGYVIFVEGAVPGDRVKAYVHRAKSSYAEAKLDTLLEPSDLRTDPRCRYAAVCGGCRWQHVDYAAQLDAKQQSVRETFEYHSDFNDVDVRSIMEAEDIFHYRNKMEFDFSADRWLTRDEIDSGRDFDTDFALGLHVPGNFYKVIDLEECHLPAPVAVRILHAVRGFAKEQGWKAWDIRKQTGFLRHLVVRTGTRTGDVMVNLVTYGYDRARMEAMTSFLRDEIPALTTLIHTSHTGKSHNVEGEERVLFGPGVIYDVIGDYRFEISPSAFFQTNTAQAERLYAVARDFADLRPTDRVYDLYCGAGTISLFLSERVREVVGVDVVEAAIENARTNAELNAVDNCVFESGDLKHVLSRDFEARHGAPNVIVADPPRAGMNPDVVDQIARLKPERVVYVSCNPSTQARDLDRLKDIYRIDAVQPVDMFPHTTHIETVVRLTRRGK